jgi:ATP synthase protein I
MLAITYKDWKGVGSFGTIGLEIVLGIVLGFFLGRWLDGKFGTAPYLSVAGFFLGVVTAVRAIIRAWKDMQRETAREEREQGNPAPLFDDKPPSNRDGRASPPPAPTSPDDDQQQPS